MFSFTMSLGGHPADPLKLERYLRKTRKFYSHLQRWGGGGEEDRGPWEGGRVGV